MNRFLALFMESKSEDERVQSIQYKVMARSGSVVFMLAFLDIIIRGGYFNRAFQEWAFSLLVVIVYLFWSFADSLVSGVLVPNLQTREDFKTRLKKSFKETVVPPFILAIIGCVKYGFPTDIKFYLMIICIFVVITAILFSISYLVLLTAWKINIKNVEQ